MDFFFWVMICGEKMQLQNQQFQRLIFYDWAAYCLKINCIMRLIWSINLVCALTNKLAALERNIKTLLTEEKCFRTADLFVVKKCDCSV